MYLPGTYNLIIMWQINATKVFKMMRKSEQGFVSALVLIFLITLALMGMGAYILVRTEGEGIARQAMVTQMDFAAEGAYFWAQKVMMRATPGTPIDSIDGQSWNINGVEVSINASPHTATSFADYDLTLSANSYGAANFTTDVVIAVKDMDLENIAVWTASTINVNEVYVCDSRYGTTETYPWNAENELMLISYGTGCDTIPTMNDATLQALALSQHRNPDLHVWTDTTVAGSSWSTSGDAPATAPDTDFLRISDGLPNVFYITGNLTVNIDDTLSGIIYVEGNVSMFGTGRINGVLYMPTSGSTLLMERGTIIQGGVIGNVRIGRNAGTGTNPIISYNPTYMQAFAAYRTYPLARGDIRPYTWTYE